MDLLPANSLVEELVNAGLDVFLLDWGMPDESMGHLGFAHYAGSYITRAVRQIKKITGTDKIQLMGQCLGGTLAAMHAAHPDHLKNLESLILLTTPIDFQDSGLLAEWTSNPDFDIEKLTQAFMAIVPHKFFHASFPLLDVSKTLGKYKTLLEHFELPGFAKIWQALDYWANDNVDFTLQAFRDLIALLYQKNAFYKGEFFIKGRKICSKDLDLPILAVAAKEDHVFTEKAAEKILDSKAGKKKRVEYHVMPAGHVTLIAAHPVKDTTYKIFKDFLLKKHKL
jgi:polyhydroxyalkanoate synthase